MTTNSFQKWLEQAMENRGWRQIDLANKADIKRQLVHAWLRLGKIPDPESLTKIATAFDVDIETVYKKAGIKLSRPQVFDENVQKILKSVEDLNDLDKEEVFAFVQMLKKLREKQSQLR